MTASTTTANEFKLPDVGEGLTEAELVTWNVAVGDTVAINDVICEIETAKSVVELPSPYAGVVQALLVGEGETVEVGTPIIRIGDALEPAAAAAPAADAVAPAAPVPASGAPAEPGERGEADAEQPLTLVGSGPKETAVSRRPRRVTSGAEAAQLQTQASFDPGAPSPEVEPETDRLDPVAPPAGEPAAPGVRPAEPEAAGVPPLAKPPVRGLAKELGVDLRSLTPSRADGVLTREDVDSAAGRHMESPAAAPAPVTSGGDVTREPIRGVRKMMGQAMVDSAFTAPHVSIWTTVDVTATTELVERLREQRELRDLRVSSLLVVAKACLLALRRTPLINSVWDDAAGEIVIKHRVNLGIAAATPRGLVVPNIKDAHAMTLPELAAAMGELVAVARSGKTPPADTMGGTFTITNVGPFGMDAGTPIINPGESAILCFGAVKRQPWVVGAGAEERIEPRDVCTLALSFDHRHIDGETGSRFLADVAALLEDPTRALMF